MAKIRRVMKRLAGDPVLLRDVYQGRIWSARPGRMVGSVDGQELAHFAHGTVCKWPCDGTGKELRVPTQSWKLQDGYWTRNSHLHFVEVGSIWTTSIHWSETGTFAGWKVDFHAPWQRSRFGFDSLDWALDVIVNADRTWRIKDEQEFSMYQQRGVISSEEALTVTQILHEKVLPDLDARKGPFAEEWKDWSPDIDQSIATLPEGWSGR